MLMDCKGPIQVVEFLIYHYTTTLPPIPLSTPLPSPTQAPAPTPTTGAVATSTAAVVSEPEHDEGVCSQCSLFTHDVLEMMLLALKRACWV
jgi:hypothetical protein